jgi:hypothetical protein
VAQEESVQAQTPQDAKENTLAAQEIDQASTRLVAR